MYKQIFIIAIIPSDIAGRKKYTLYLFEKKHKYIIPIEVEQTAAGLLLGKRDLNSPNHPSIYNTVKRLVSGLGGKVVSITVYKFENEKFYSYLNVVFQNKHLEFNIHIADAVNIAKRFEAPIFIKTELLEKCGIKVTKKILRDALREEL